MKILVLNLLFLLSLFPMGSFAEVTGKVVDAETGEPIEGAVVLVEWTVTKGMPGMTHTESLKVVEVLSDSEGKFTIDDQLPKPVIDSPFMIIYEINPPRVTIYKKGYVAWNSRIIFPGYRKRGDFKLKDNFLYELERFKPEYSFNDHIFFIMSSILYGSGDKKLIVKAFEWERKKASDERLRMKKK